MKIIKPDYCNAFKCIADKCKNNCCIGWEIDIDKSTADRYLTDNGVLSNKLLNSIVISDEGAYFKLDKNKRCPFLTKSGLCEIISEYGQDALCEICKEHPRFYNEYENFYEQGLGLCCEQACCDILLNDAKFYIDSIQYCTENEKPFIKLRQTFFDILQDREFTICERIDNLCDFFDITFKNFEFYKNLYLNLEILNDCWKTALKNTNSFSDVIGFDCIFEQLAVYFAYRHLQGGIYDDLLKQRIAFCILSVKMIMSVCVFNGVCDKTKILNICSTYSSEIEYSDQNIEQLLKSIL